VAVSFDSVRHDLLLAKVARRVNDGAVLHLLKLMLKASGKRGVPQGGVISPLLSNIYLTEVDAMLERAKAVARNGQHTYIEYARYADDLVILVNNDRRQGWLVEAVDRRLREELAKLDVRLNEEKSRVVDLSRGESFGFLGFDFRRVRSLRGRWRPQYTPTRKARTAVAQGGVSAVRLAASGAGDRGDQSDSAGLGQLLPDRARGSVLCRGEVLGRAEGAAASDAGEEPPGLRLEEVASGVVA
jgi:Reverse transcriptase (RNA-dependent DNA polymerase)